VPYQFAVARRQFPRERWRAARAPRQMPRGRHLCSPSVLSCSMSCELQPRQAKNEQPPGRHQRANQRVTPSWLSGRALWPWPRRGPAGLGRQPNPDGGRHLYPGRGPPYGIARAPTTATSHSWYFKPRGFLPLLLRASGYWVPRAEMRYYRYRSNVYRGLPISAYDPAWATGPLVRWWVVDAF